MHKHMWMIECAHLKHAYIYALVIVDQCADAMRMSHQLEVREESDRMLLNCGGQNHSFTVSVTVNEP